MRPKRARPSNVSPTLGDDALRMVYAWMWSLDPKSDPKFRSECAYLVRHRGEVLDAKALAEFEAVPRWFRSLPSGPAG
jgi:hypothetical protein